MNKTRLAWVVALACVVLTGGIPDLQAQTTASKPAAVNKDSDDSIWELDILDGALRRQQDGTTAPATLKTIVSYLRNLYPANVVLAPGVGDIKVPDLKLANFDWSQGLEALKVASGEAFLWDKRAPGDQTIDPTTGIPTKAIEGAMDLYVLSLNPESPSQRSKRSVEVFNLSNYLRGSDPAKTLADIELILRDTMTELNGASGLGPRLQFHPSAGLLIVIGSPDEIAVARQVILALPEVSSSKATGSTGWTVPEGTAKDDVAREAFLRRYGMMPNSPQNPTQVNPNPKR